MFACSFYLPTYVVPTYMVDFSANLIIAADSLTGMEKSPTIPFFTYMNRKYKNIQLKYIHDFLLK